MSYIVVHGKLSDKTDIGNLSFFKVTKGRTYKLMEDATGIARSFDAYMQEIRSRWISSNNPQVLSNAFNMGTQPGHLCMKRGIFKCSI